MQSPDTQLQTLRTYKTLVDHRDDWAGLLVFSCGPEAPRSGMAPAASIAGAASLLVSAEGHEIKKAFRRGEIDFVVNSLDEAIRALKNEVRKKRPLSVALIADVDATVSEMVERGLQPDMFLAGAAYPEAVRSLIDRGMPVFAAQPEGDGSPLTIHGEEHFEYFLATTTPTKLREAGERVLRMLPKDEAVRRRWMERAPHYLRGAGDGRWAYLSEAEAMLLESEGLSVRAGAILLLPEQSLPTGP